MLACDAVRCVPDVQSIRGPSIDRSCQKVAVSEPLDGSGTRGTVVNEPCSPFLTVGCPLHCKVLLGREARCVAAREQRPASKCSVSQQETALWCDVYGHEMQHQLPARCSRRIAFLKCALAVSALRAFAPPRAPPRTLGSLSAGHRARRLFVRHVLRRIPLSAREMQHLLRPDCSGRTPLLDWCRLIERSS
jgi:hypothetical protein